MYVSLVSVRVGNLAWSDAGETPCVFVFECVCVCVCVCSFRSVNLTLNPTQTLLPNPDYHSIHAAVDSGTPRCC